MWPSNGVTTSLLAAALLGFPSARSSSNGPRSVFLPPGVQVTPDGLSTATRTPLTNNYTATFTVKNTLGSQATFGLTRESSANVTTTGQDYTIVTLASQAQIDVNVYYNVGAAGSGYVRLWAEGSGAFDSGTWNVPVGPSAQVTPDGGTTADRQANTGGYSESFWITNQEAAPVTFTLSCAGSPIVTCSGVSPSSVNVAGGAQTSATATYSVGDVGTGTLTLTATGGVGSDQGSFNVPVVSYGVSVGPQGSGAPVRRANTSGYSQLFTVQNTGSGPNTYSLTCGGSPNVTCTSLSQTSVPLNPNESANITAFYSVGAEGWGTLSLSAVGTNTTGGGFWSVPVEQYLVAVGPDGTATPIRPTSSSWSETFTVRNNGTAVTGPMSDTYTFICSSTSQLTCGTVTPASATVSVGAQQMVTVNYTTTTTTGPGTLTLTANGVASDPGYYAVQVERYSVAVGPDSTIAPNRLTNTSGYSEAFTVQNTGSLANTYTLTCGGSSNVTCTSLSQTSVPNLAANATQNITAFYNVGATGTGTLSVNASGTNATDSGWYRIPVISYSVAVTPDSGEELPRRPNSSGGATFTVRNTGTQADTFSFTCTASGNITCARDGFGAYMISPTSATLAGGVQTTVAVTYNTGEIGTGRVYLNAIGHHSTDQGWFWVPVSTGTVGVTPSNGWSKGAFTSTSYTQTFVVSNPDTAGHQYALSCIASSNVVCPTGSLPTLVLTGGQSQNVPVGYSISAGATGTGWIKVCVNSVDLCVGPFGKLNFQMWPNVAHGVAVTPTPATGPNRGSFTNGYSTTYTVRNVGTSSDTYNFTCVAPANVTCGTVTPASQLLSSLDTTVVTVNYSAGATGSAYVSLQASNANANNTGQMSFTVVGSAGYTVAVSPDAKSVGVLASSSASYPFTVTNPGTAQNTYTIAATCTGAAIASGCTPSSTSLTVPAKGSNTVNVTYTSGGASTTGTIKLSATQSNDAGIKDTAWINLSTGTAQAPTVVVNTVNPGVTPERDLCLTVALAGGAAAECGDLRLAHGLPAVRTTGKVRAPTLVYSTAQAHPYPLVAAEVTLPTGAANPDSVELVLKLNGVERRRARWAGSAFSPGRANRVVIGYDALNDSTGVYSYTLDVTNIYPGSSLSAATPGSGEFIIVNRSQSEYGAGWWLAGLERIRLDSMLWIGGDGSARVYRPAGSKKWSATAVDRPDTLKKVGTEYVRLLPAKAEVWFDAQGRHVRTVSRLRHDTTYFHRNPTTGVLDSITVAPSSQAVRYRFKYGGTPALLDSVIAPPAGSIPRATKLTRSGSRITAIRDPDTSSVGFTYDGGYANRIITRTDRIGVAVSYFFDAAGKVLRDSLDPAFGQPVIVKRLRAHESAGFIGAAALDTAVASAAMDGPRTDVGDSTLFWADRFGAPRRIRNALGNETTVSRQNATYPALVTRSQGPTGQVMRAHYDARAHVDTLTDSATIVNGQPAVTRYVWDVSWDAVTRIVPPEGDSTVIGLEASTGHRIWQQDASGTASRDTFTYYSNGLVATMREAGASAVTTLNYDTRGNLRVRISPLGFRDSVYSDNLGRDTLTLSPPLDSAGTMKYQRVRTTYDLVSRVIKTVTSAPAMPYTVTVSGVSVDTMPVSADSVITQTYYDRESRPIEIDGGPTVELRTYDRAGRVLTKRVGSGPTGFTYDAAGNAVAESYRNGTTATAQFDALNRVVQRVVPRVAYGPTNCFGHVSGPVTGDPTGCLFVAPYVPNALGDSLVFPADTLLFAYDTAGNMIRADNRYAQVRRSYYLNGILATDTLRVRNYIDDAFGHAYTLRYGFDRDGRRRWMTLAGLAASDSFSYAYSTANGGLTQITDGAGRRYAVTYKPNGRLDSLKVFASGAGSPGIKESYQYDADGRLIVRERRTGANALLQLDNLVYTPTGKVLRANTQSAAVSQGTQFTRNAYGGLSAVVASELQNSSSAYWNLEEFRADKLGSVWYQHTRYAAEQVRPSSQSSYTADGLLYARSGAFPDGCAPGTPYIDTLYQTADAAGNVIRSGDKHDSGCDGHAHDAQTATNSYYSADNRLMVVQRSTIGSKTWEEYWYDALGRRVMVRTRHDLPSCTQQPSQSCPGFVERTVWDGDQLIGEQRTSGLDLVTGGAPYYGTVRYVHLVGMDAPVAILDARFSDARVIHYNWRGLAEASSFADGSPADCELGSGSCTRIAWNAGEGVYFKRNTDPYAGMTPTWIGSLPANGKGDAGLLYRRNRFFDPASGRFTQEDPIGLGGGLNLYGFGSGDPVNFSDPFGLCVLGKKDCKPSVAGLQFIAREEGFRSTQYADEAGHATIGYGHRIMTGETFGASGISEKQGMELLISDVDQRAMPGLSKVAVNLNQNQVDALGSFVFNVGSNAFAGSTLLSNVNNGELNQVPNEMRRWVRAGGHLSSVLVRRREREAQLFQREVQ